MMTGKYGDTECMFLKDMVLHHDIAVIMAKDCFRHSKNPRILELTRSIIYLQEMEIAQMRGFQRSYDQSSTTVMATLPTMLDKQFEIGCQETTDQGWGPYSRVYRPLKRDKSFHISMERMDKLWLDKTGVYNKNGDTLFLTDMIVHHQIAIEMALHMQRLTLNPALLSFLRGLIWNQSKEIWQMRMILRNYDKSFWMSHSGESGEVERSKYSHYLPIQSTSKEIEKEPCYLKF